MTSSLSRRLAAEALGTAFLLAIIVGSGIMAERLSGGSAALALLANALATGFGLAALIACFGPVSGAHFNPVVTLSLAARGELVWKDAAPYIGVQVVSAAAGVVAAHLMFDEPFALSTKVRSGPHQLASEFVATFGLVLIVWACVRQRLAAAPAWIAAYIAAAYWFTASTSFANPAVTLARCLTDTFSGVRPADVAGFMAAQLAGSFLATWVASWLFPAVSASPPRG